MTEQSEPGYGEQSTRRGEAAWKAQKAAIAERNDKARKAGKEQRRAHERRIAASRPVDR